MGILNPDCIVVASAPVGGTAVAEQTIAPGSDAVNGVQQVRQSFQLLGKATAVDTNIVGRPAFVHALTCSNPSATAFEVYLSDGTTGTGADSAGQRFNVPANSSITHMVNRTLFVGVRIRGAAAFPAGAEISATGA
ncbi:MAG: hypothetical protein LW768_19400 [Rubrivivax sp.]|jgi:hypothetical protein|nr:hypothetical protein [Rubrivivax sp.]